MDSMRLIDLLFVIIGGLLSMGWVASYATIKQLRNDITKTAELVLSEKEKAAALVKIEHDRLQEEITNFRIEVAKEYATAMLVEKVLNPIITQLKDIQNLLHHKLDRREFEQHLGKDVTGK